MATISQAQATLGEAVTAFNNANAHLASGDSTTAHIHAALRPPSKAERDAAKAALLAAGFTVVTWERRAPDSGALRRKTRVAYRTQGD